MLLTHQSLATASLHHRHHVLLQIRHLTTARIQPLHQPITEPVVNLLGLALGEQGPVDATADATIPQGHLVFVTHGGAILAIEKKAGDHLLMTDSVYEPARIPSGLVPQEVVLLGGEARRVESVIPDGAAKVTPAPEPKAERPTGPTRRAPLGHVVGARSGDKGGNANLGVFARDDAAWAWLDHFLTTERLRALLPEVARFQVERHRLPNLRSLNFVVIGLLEEGVAAATRQDGQAKSLGEWLRARVAEVPEALLP